MIEDIIKIHDKYQFEVKLNYKLENDARLSTYEVETFFFIPNSLGVNKHTYKKDDFYSDIKSYIRFKTPSLLLHQIYSGERSPMSNLKNSYVRLAESGNKGSRAALGDFEYQNKMFSAILKSALRDHVGFIYKRENPSDVRGLIERYLDAVRHITTEFRQLRQVITVPSVPEQAFSIFRFSDEYLSLLVEKYSYNLLDLLKGKQRLSAQAFSGELLRLIRSEVSYREENDYRSIPSEESDNETLIFRFSVLKKYLESVLFLDVNIEQEGRVWEELLMSLAAGLAMIFATTVAFLTQKKYGNFTFPLFVALVISYMFKDRIKEFGRAYFARKLSRFVFDHKTDILVESKKKIGKYRESADFIKLDKVPGEILKIRNRDRTIEFDNKFAKEKILLYRKKILLFPNMFKKIYHGYPIDGVNDIVRFNVLRFLNKMDNPRKSIYMVDGDSYKKIYGERVYHVNMVMKYTMEQSVAYKRLRLILNRNGIKRIEKIPAKGI